MGKTYTSFLEYMESEPGIICDESVEIGKCEFDSIALDSGIIMITPYFKNTEKSNNLVISADFKVCDRKPIAIMHNNSEHILESIDTKFVKRFITHNPYTQGCIENWEQLHNSKENITIGIFGSIYDKDMETKIKQVENLRNSLYDEEFKEEYETDEDNYFYVVSSDREIKVLKKVLTR